MTPGHTDDHIIVSSTDQNVQNIVVQKVGKILQWSQITVLSYLNTVFIENKIKIFKKKSVWL